MKPTFLIATATAIQAAYWMEQVPHRGISSFNPDSTYTIFRNVRDYGAKGDGGRQTLSCDCLC